jgi:hypothetical protein
MATKRSKKKSDDIDAGSLTFETGERRRLLKEFYDRKMPDPISGEEIPLGNFRYGVYAFYDYDGEPIYVGQTNNTLRDRIGRHMTNQRTDAVAMKVLDPFEVYAIEVWPLPEFNHLNSKSHKDERAEAKLWLNALERIVYDLAVKASRFQAVLNEKVPADARLSFLAMPTSYKGIVVSPELLKLREHRDIRIARRAATLASLSQIISERQVQKGLRTVLQTQARRLEWLASERLRELGHLLQDEVKTESEEESD